VYKSGVFMKVKSYCVRIWGSHGNEYQSYVILGCDTVYFCANLWSNLLPPSTGYEKLLRNFGNFLPDFTVLQSTTASLQILSSSSFTSHPAIRRYIVEVLTARSNDSWRKSTAPCSSPWEPQISRTVQLTWTASCKNVLGLTHRLTNDLQT
jgi:hypothetical protein